MNTEKKTNQKGLTLIELIVAVFIFSLIAFAIIAVFVSAAGAHRKARAVKLVKENAEFALASIAKEVRMGKVEKNSSYSSGSRKSFFMLTRNRDQRKICYVFSEGKLSLFENTTNCSNGTEKNLIDLSGTGMIFRSASGFYACPSALNASDPGYYACPSAAEFRRGWVEINLDIGNPSLETDEISVQTVVSSRDYGWEDID